MVGEQSGPGYRAGRRGRRGTVFPVVLVGRAANAPVRGVRLLAREPELLSRPSRRPFDHHLVGLCVVLLGFGRTWLQPVDTAGAGVASGLLGAYRIRLRAILDSA